MTITEMFFNADRVLISERRASYPKRLQRETPRLEDSKMRGIAYKAIPRPEVRYKAGTFGPQDGL